MSTDASRLAVRSVVAIYREFEQIARRSDISMAQYRLLLFLLNGPKRAGAIAAAAELAKPTVSLAINGLREKGWVKSGPGVDGRASVVTITPEGYARMTSFEQDLAQNLNSMLDDPADLAAALAKAYAAMDATKEIRMKNVLD